jgi:hypothetical protein
MAEPVQPNLRTIVGHGLEILTQAIGKRAFNLDVKPIAQSSIDRFVRENVSDKPISLEGLLEDAGVLRRNPKRLK